jgi:hypothetical protein
MVFVLVITNFTDDYKPRGGSWSNNENPRVFQTRESANIALTKILQDYISEYDISNHQKSKIGAEYFIDIKEEDDDDDDEDDEDEKNDKDDELDEKSDKNKQKDELNKDKDKDINNELNKDKDKIKISTGYVYNTIDFDKCTLSDLESIVKVLSVGEYISCRFQWEITECEIE